MERGVNREKKKLWVLQNGKLNPTTAGANRKRYTNENSTQRRGKKGHFGKGGKGPCKGSTRLAPYKGNKRKNRKKGKGPPGLRHTLISRQSKKRTEDLEQGGPMQRGPEMAVISESGPGAVKKRAWNPVGLGLRLWGSRLGFPRGKEGGERRLGTLKEGSTESKQQGEKRERANQLTCAPNAEKGKEKCPQFPQPTRKEKTEGNHKPKSKVHETANHDEDLSKNEKGTARGASTKKLEDRWKDVGHSGSEAIGG